MGASHSQEPQTRRVQGRGWLPECRESSYWERISHKTDGLQQRDPANPRFPWPSDAVHMGQPPGAHRQVERVGNALKGRRKMP